jgi:hypothetical protein
MKLYNKKIIVYSLLALTLMQQIACKKDYTDPSKAPQDDALNSPRGLTGIAIGLQRVYTQGRASSLYNTISCDGLVTNQLLVLNPGNTGEFQLSQGGDKVFPDNNLVTGLWTSSNKIIYDANNVIINADKLEDKSYASGLIGYVSIFKALSIGNLAMFWNQVPDSIGLNVPFISQIDGYKRAIEVIDAALSRIAANPISSLFTSAVPVNPAPASTPAIDIVNTLKALKARYALFAGNYSVALAAANEVDLTKRSTFNFDAVTLNPIFETAGSNINVYQPTDSTMGLPAAIAPEAGDKRVPFYITTMAHIVRFRINGFGGTGTSSWPVYLPGEITLIKAEAYARQNSIPDAIIQLNRVRTKKPAEDPFLVGADLPLYAGSVSQAAILQEIYRQRAIELYMSGLRLEDMRRLNRPTSERKRSFLPFPTVERNNNTNTPTDPGF